MKSWPAYGHWQLVIVNSLIVLVFGFLIQWPTLPTVIMFPILVWFYIRLAKREEKEALQFLGEVYACYAGRTPRFVPRILISTSDDRSAANCKGVKGDNPKPVKHTI